MLHNNIIVLYFVNRNIIYRMYIASVVLSVWSNNSGIYTKEATERLRQFIKLAKISVIFPAHFSALAK